MRIEKENDGKSNMLELEEENEDKCLINQNGIN